MSINWVCEFIIFVKVVFSDCVRCKLWGTLNPFFVFYPPVLYGVDVEIHKPAERVLIHRVYVGQISNTEEQDGWVLGDRSVTLSRLCNLDLCFLRNLGKMKKPKEALRTFKTYYSASWFFYVFLFLLIHTCCFFVISLDMIFAESRICIALSSSSMFPSEDCRVSRILSSISFNCLLLSADCRINAFLSSSSSGL